MTPLVSIIIPQLNRLELLKACLASLRAQSYRNFEIIVVDNASKDGSREWLRQQQGLVLVEMETNTGFTGANLAGLERAKGGIVVALNNDTEADPDWLEQALKPFERDPRIGIVASCLVEHARPDILDSAGDGFSRAGRGIKFGSGESRRLHGEGAYVFGACAAAALYRREMLDEVGFFDARFFFNSEDVDLGVRSQLAGWRCWYEPRATVRHHVSASHKEIGTVAIFYWSRNCELLWVKNIPLALWPLLLPPKLLQESLTLLRNLFSFRHTWAFLRGKAAALALIPAVWPERPHIQAARKISALEFYSLLSPSFDWPGISARLRRFARSLRGGRP